MKKNIPSRISYLRYLSNALIDQELKIRGINDLHTSYGSIIYSLQKNEALTMKELARDIGRDKSTLTVLIKKLESNGYINIKVNNKDKRSKIISLTKKGSSIKLDFESISLKLNETLWKDINENEAQAFELILNKMIYNIENEVKA